MAAGRGRCGVSLVVFCSFLFLFVCFLLIGAYSGATFDAGRSLLTTTEVSARFHFLRVSEGEALALFFF